MHFLERPFASYELLIHIRVKCLIFPTQGLWPTVEETNTITHGWPLRVLMVFHFTPIGYKTQLGEDWHPQWGISQDWTFWGLWSVDKWIERCWLQQKVTLHSSEGADQLIETFLRWQKSRETWLHLTFTQYPIYHIRQEDCVARTSSCTPALSLDRKNSTVSHILLWTVVLYVFWDTSIHLKLFITIIE